MTVLSASQMNELEAEGFFEGFLCGASVGTLIAVAVSPEPISKIALGTLWSTAIGSCGIAIF
jgi:hypothetical protein